MVSMASQWTVAKSIGTTLASVTLLVVLVIKGIKRMKSGRATR